MTDKNELEQEPRSGLSDLTAKLERLIDGDVTCWGIDDVIAYGMKVIAMEREDILEQDPIAFIRQRIHGSPGLDWNDNILVTYTDHITKKPDIPLYTNIKVKNSQLQIETLREA